MSPRRLSEKNEARLREMAAELYTMAKGEDAKIINVNGYCDWDEPCFPSVHLRGCGNPGYCGEIIYHEPTQPKDDQ